MISYFFIMNKFKIAWLYDDIMNLYGDGGNILVLEHLLKCNQIDYQIDRISLGNYQNLADFDILFIGGGSDFAQSLIYEDLLKRKEQIIELLNNNGFILTICGGYQLFGEAYFDNEGHQLKGLNIFPYITKANKTRMNGNIVSQITLDQDYLVCGYENHSGETTNVVTPFGKVISGFGNTLSGNDEGFMYKNFIGTYIHGPLLPKNPEIGKYMIEYVLLNKYNIHRDLNINLKYAKKAHDVMINRLVDKDKNA